MSKIKWTLLVVLFIVVFVALVLHTEFNDHTCSGLHMVVDCMEAFHGQR